MKVVIDTNVLISGVFFSGPPFQILKAWRDNQISIVISPEILYEYESVLKIIGKKFPNIDVNSFLNLLKMNTVLISVPKRRSAISADKDDDKFIYCAIAGKVKIIISGDKHLKDVSGYKGIIVESPRAFCDKHIKS